MVDLATARAADLRADPWFCSVADKLMMVNELLYP